MMKRRRKNRKKMRRQKRRRQKRRRQKRSIGQIRRNRTMKRRGG